ncbi:MAG TPA: hypothetical protein VFF39_10160 [Verrucomicrobiae bacterium]|nr:hypothetical protein [Verrucomicrobiae bacterium]
MITTKLFRRIGPVLCFLLAGLCHAQSFVFASPNTRTHMPDSVALASQDSFEQQNFLAVGRYLAARLCPTLAFQPKSQTKANAHTNAPARAQAAAQTNVQTMVQASVGLDGLGAENSLMVTGCKNGPAEYLSMLLARYGHQKWGLVFISAKAGPERLFVITLSGIDPEQTLQQMRKHGITDGTVVLQRNRILVYVWVQKNLEQEEAGDSSMHKNIRAFAEDSHGEIQEIAGAGKLIGDEDRTKAQRILDENIARYERAHGTALSALLWTKKLRDMGFSRPETPSSPLKTDPAGHGVPSALPLAP